MAGREYAAVRGDSLIAPSGLPGLTGVIDERPSTPAAPSAASASTPTGPRASRLRAAAVVALGLLIALGAFAVRTRRRAPPPRQPIAFREPVLLADFANTTGEAVFDGALKNALEIQLQQSPYMNVVPVSQVRSALQLMGRPPDDRVSAAVAHDLCQRVGV